MSNKREEIVQKMERRGDAAVVAIAPDILAELNLVPKVKDFFDSLPDSHKKEYLSWIEEAKKEETRARRIKKFVTMLDEDMKLRQI